ncbi:MAG: efflux transporter outer membrane subunit [Hydrogenophaga sp.]|uniref:efflux transporter outer membrane subunit n=1 Tax=Hydrogenophaga sp. TaxID=1904254 RepID=UPI0025B853B8|nr:efflux transporter outer membrane subunit [Hydrogenophaga sp.]MBT9550373.1 efflux transporter outer membrane subunit [Hydrogenophaga sp.]
MYTSRTAGWRTFKTLLAIGLAIALGGCAAVGPNHAQPEPAAPPAWQAPLPHGGQVAALGDWWSQFNDPVLTRLQRAAESGSPTLAKAWANIEKARATLTSAGASGLPSANGVASATRGTQQTGGVATARSAGLDASWELDLFGKVRRSTESAQALAQARENDWHDARTSLAAEVADTYVQYRACGLLASAYEQELASMNETVKATESLVRAGLTATTDGSLARASLASTSSAALAQRAQCELLVKSLVDLTGTGESALRTQLAQGGADVPQPRGIDVRSVPAQALRQRPDLASRERELAAASAEIGVAQADLYPSLSLSGSIDVSVVGVASALTSWSFGPALSLPLFDGGRRRAAVDSARAGHDAAYADWRQAVRTAVKDVEQSLVRLDSTAKRTEQAERAAQEYRRYLVGAEAQWRAGSTSLLDLEDARRQALSAQIELIGLQRDRVAHWIALYKALGGDWQSGTPATPPEDVASKAKTTP